MTPLFSALLGGQVVLVNVTLDPNSWEALFTSVGYVVIFRGWFGGCAIASALWALSKWFRIVRWGGQKLSLLSTQQSCFAIEFVSNSIRAVFLVCDGLWATAVLTLTEKQILVALWQPLSIISCAFLAHAWGDIVSVQGGLSTFLNNRRSLVISGVVLCVVEAWATVSRLYGASRAAVSLSGGLYLLLHLCFGCFFVFHGVCFGVYWLDSRNASMC